MRVHPLAGAAVLLVAGGLFAAESDARRPEPRAAGGAASLLGGFSALVVQVLWARADQALIEQREDEAHFYLDAIARMEPELVTAAEFVARKLGLDLAEGHSDPRVRWALGRQGWAVLCRTVAANPRNARARTARGWYALGPLWRDPAMHEGFLAEIDREGPLEAARSDFEIAAALDPALLEAHEGLALAAMYRGIALEVGGRWGDAARVLRQSVAAYDATIARYAAGGMTEEELSSRRNAAALAAALAEAAEAPGDERAARYEAVRRRFPGYPLPSLE